ncbi:MAG TPA: alpha/beta hydrolase [Agromyces mariniharenae]|nr:alpha/beta hydrolase [Agromyces mariniharenae]
MHLDLQDGPTILVGHSWGGTVITEAGNHPAVAGLVYVSALAPDSGENTSMQYEGFAPTPNFVIDVVDDGFGFLNHDTFKIGFAADASDEDAGFLRDTQVPINISAFATQVKHAARCRQRRLNTPTRFPPLGPARARRVSWPELEAEMARAAREDLFRRQAGSPPLLLACEEHDEDAPQPEVVGQPQWAEHEFRDQVDGCERVGDGGDPGRPRRRSDTMLAVLDRVEESPHASSVRGHDDEQARTSGVTMP